MRELAIIILLICAGITIANGPAEYDRLAYDRREAMEQARIMDMTRERLRTPITQQVAP